MRASIPVRYVVFGIVLFLVGLLFRGGMDLSLPPNSSSSTLAIEASINYPGATRVRNEFRSRRLHNDTFWRMSYPLVLSGPILKHGETQVMEYSGTVCFTGACEGVKMDRPPKLIQGDVIAMPCSGHYFHFVFETATMLESLHIHGMLEEFPDATLLCYDAIPSPSSRQMLELMGIPLPGRIELGKPDVLYQATGLMIVPPFHNYHYHREPYSSYNQWLLQSIRSRMTPSKLVTNTSRTITSDNDGKGRAIFVSRKGYRRGILQEEELFTKLKTVLPHLESILPDDFSVAEQANLFASADLIISPHGASLTNLIFADWSKVTVVEVTPVTRAASFRMDTGVQQHYLFTCPSEPGEKDLWDKHLDCDVDNMVDVIKTDVLVHSHNATWRQIEPKRNIPGTLSPPAPKEATKQ